VCALASPLLLLLPPPPLLLLNCSSSPDTAIMTVVSHEFIDLQDIHDFLVELAKKAGEMALAANPSTLTADSKKNCQLPQLAPGLARMSLLTPLKLPTW
jgi:hypothetical protein